MVKFINGVLEKNDSARQIVFTYEFNLFRRAVHLLSLPAQENINKKPLVMTRAFTRATTPYEVLIKVYCSALSVTLVVTEKVQELQIITGTSESKSDIGEK